MARKWKRKKKELLQAIAERDALIVELRAKLAARPQHYRDTSHLDKLQVALRYRDEQIRGLTECIMKHQKEIQELKNKRQ